MSDFWVLIVRFFGWMFSGMGDGLGSALLFVFLEGFLWFFGIHGSNALGTINGNIFVPATDANVAAYAAGESPTHIFTKTMLDAYTMNGGCGMTLALLIAILLFSKRKSNRSLAKIAAVPMLFNINEIMVFGLPIIYNPIMFFPFVIAPIVTLLIAAAAMKLGLVPLTITSVEWTTPIFLQGYEATGSISGAVLQGVNLVVAVLIYMPFVKLLDRRKEEQAREDMDKLVKTYQDAEKHNREINLTKLEGTSGALARVMVNELKGACENQKLYLLYQPQFNDDKEMFGAEALLRWKHEQYGMVYPPLIIKIAEEAGFLTELEKAIFLHAQQDILQMPDVEFSINVTAQSLRDDDFIETITNAYRELLKQGYGIYIEITEQGELVADQLMANHMAQLKKCGFKLAVDDFSMGHTSLKYLQGGEFDLVKLDGSLSKALLQDDNTKYIIDSIMHLSKTSGFDVLAEFVETEEQKNEFKELGCIKYQGYLYSPAISFRELCEKKAAEKEKRKER